MQPKVDLHFPWREDVLSDGSTTCIRDATGLAIIPPFHFLLPNLRAILKICLAIPELIAACQAAVKYDASIYGKAARGEVTIAEGMGIAQADDLDDLYLDWITKSRAALTKAGFE